MLARFRHFDWVLLAAVVVIMGCSLLSLASTAPSLALQQLVWILLALGIIFAGSQVSWRWLGGQPWFRYGLYWVAIGFLIVSNVQSATIRGTRSWLSFGGLQFQPSELAKLALILVLASFFSRRHIAAWSTKNLFLSLGYMLLPAVLTVIHPDLGSASIIAAIWFGFLIMCGIHAKRFLIGLAVAVVALALVWSFFLKPYQKDRVTAFLDATADPLGINYNVTQSKIAIGSAGLWGKGFGAGTQVQLKFLPEAQTDFIFAAFTEEWGVLGAALLLLTFGVLMARIVAIGLRAGDNYSRFLALGGGVFFLVHFLINTGSAVGLLPVAGVTFPFLSYGGSNILTGATLVGIIEHIKLESSK